MDLKYDDDFEKLKRKIFENKTFIITIPEENGQPKLTLTEFILIRLHKRLDDIEKILKKLYSQDVFTFTEEFEETLYKKYVDEDHHNPREEEEK